MSGNSIGIWFLSHQFVAKITKACCAPDFFSDDQAVQKKTERKGKGGRYQGEYTFRFYIPGLDPESTFREMAKIDFDTAMSQSSALTDKFQRSLSTLALADVCLAQTQQLKEKPKKK